MHLRDIPSVNSVLDRIDFKNIKLPRQMVVDTIRAELFFNRSLTDKEKIFLDNNLYFTIILWPSVFKYFDDIQQYISDQFYILDYLDYNNVKNFDEFVRQLYAIDDIKEWKIQ